MFIEQPPWFFRAIYPDAIFLVELFGGTIEVTSQICEGTTFTLTFPLTTKA